MLFVKPRTVSIRARIVADPVMTALQRKRVDGDLEVDDGGLEALCEVGRLRQGPCTLSAPPRSRGRHFVSDASFSSPCLASLPKLSPCLMTA
jgi:hypothetical protein